MAAVLMARGQDDERRLVVALEHENVRRILDGRPFLRDGVPGRSDVAVSIALRPHGLSDGAPDPLVAVTEPSGMPGRTLYIVYVGEGFLRELLQDFAPIADSMMEIPDVGGMVLEVVGTPNMEELHRHLTVTGAIRGDTVIIDQRAEAIRRARPSEN